MKKQILFFFSSILLLVCVLYGFTKQQQEIQAEKHKVTVTLVLIDVAATDKKGNFITNLTKDDFELYEDGKGVPINSLELISLLKEEFEEPKKKDIKQSGLPPRKKRLIVIFDSINTIKRVLEENKPKIIERLISLVQLGREIMVFELSEKEGMQTLQPFSKDEKLIAQAVTKASGSIWLEKEADALAVPDIFEKAARESAPKSRGGFGFDPEAFKASSREIFQLLARKRFEKTINGMLAVMNIIKEYPGRKPVLLISGGIPSLSSFQTYGLTTSAGRTKIFGDSSVLSEMAAAKMVDPFKILKKKGIRRGEDVLKDFIHFANSHNITFYALDPDNYLRYVMQDMAYENFPRSAHDISQFNTDEIQELKKNELSNLKIMAEDTGGASFMGAKKFENFKKVMTRDLTYCYELSYYPPREKADGKYHKINVKVKQPGVKIRFRRGYHDYTEKQKESLLFASASYNPSLFKQIPFEARAVPFVLRKDKFILWINMALPVKELILGESEEGTLKKLKLNISIDDLSDEKAVSAQFNIPLILTPSFRKSLEKAKYFGFNSRSQALKLKKDKYLMVFALYDENRSRMGTVEHMIDVPVPDSNTEAEIVNAVFGNLVKNKRIGSSAFSISQKDGTLQLSKNAFYPMGVNQFRRRKNISLFLQVYSPHKVFFESKFFLAQNGENKGILEAEVVDELWNKKAKIWNVVFNLNVSGFTKGEYVLSIKLIDSLDKQEIEKKLLIKII